MGFSWKREIFVSVQHIVMALAASSFALVFQADALERERPAVEGLIVDYSRMEVIKGSGVFYGWLLLLLAAFSAARLLIVRAWRRGPDNFS